MTGSPSMTENPSLGIAALSEKALPDMRWQPVQWQAMVSKGGALMRIFTPPQRHAPSSGSLGLLMGTAPLPLRRLVILIVAPATAPQG